MSLIREYWPIVMVAAALIGLGYLIDYRVNKIEQRLEKTNIEQMSWQMRGVRCEVRNIKRVIQQKPEIDCDDQ